MRGRMFWSLLLLAGCAEKAPPAAPPQPDHRVIATVDGQPILQEDVSPATRMEIFRRELDVYTLLTAEVERMVDERLLAAEAARRGLDVEALLAAEVDETVMPPTAAEVDAAMAEQGAPEAARPRVELYVAERARIQRRLDFMASLRGATKVEVKLAAPEPPRMPVDITGAPSRGPESAPVVLVAFLDWRSPMSAKCAQNLARVMEAHPGRLRLAHRSVLRGGDELGLGAAILAEMADEKGLFWTVHDALLLRPTAWSQADLHDVARQVQVEPERLDAARQDPTWLMRMKKAMGRVQEAGVTAPPVVYVNGRWFGGTFGYEQLDRVVQEELQRAQGAQR